MSWTIWMAVAVVLVTVWALVKRFETRLVLLVAGLVMALLSGDPMAAFRQFDKSMTNPNLIIAICSALGFAGVVTVTKCDVHLVALLVKPLKKLGVFLLPACMIVTGIVAVALPSTAGCVAAVGPTMIPLMLRAGFKPAAAAAAVVGAVTPAFLNPGVSHNVFIAKISNMEVMDFLGQFAPYTVAISLAVSVGAPQLKMSVATAMLLGMIYAVAVTRTAPDKATKEFFNGMGSGYAKILGIIIAAGVFAAGLRAAGVIDVFVKFLTTANDIAKLGGSVGPFALAVLTGSGDAAAFAFNEAVTPHAVEFGMTPAGLGYLAAIAASCGRQASPLCGGLILAAGLANVSPVDICKRTAPVMLVALIGIYFFVG